MDCGPTCLKIISKYYKKKISLQHLRDLCNIDRSGVSLRGIASAAYEIGFKCIAVKLPVLSVNNSSSIQTASLPAILHWNQNHFVVLYKVNKKYAWISDPAKGKYKLSLQQFSKNWKGANSVGIALLLEPTESFKSKNEDLNYDTNFSILLKYITPHHKLVIQLLLGLILGTVFQLIFPFLTQSLVDTGIGTKNISFINVLLAAQLMIFFSATITRFIQNWILLHITIRVNISLLSDYLIKLMNLPLSYFDKKNTGDLLQRINDHKRIDEFLTKSSLKVLFAITNLIVFGIVLYLFHSTIFIIFMIASIIYIIWILIFLKYRRVVDNNYFFEMSENQDSLLEIIQGIQEIKLQDSLLKRRSKWAEIQARLFDTQMKSLAVNQYQDGGASFVNQLKDIIITFFAAKLVIEGSLTLGTMLAIQYIIGQLNGPLQQLVAFIRSAQDAMISLERMMEIKNIPNEYVSQDQTLKIESNSNIVIEDLSFKYSENSKDVLSNINLEIPSGKTTAIVGTSGSGKTTLIKLLLGFYPPTEGGIKIGNNSFKNIDLKEWRRMCGVVLQDGYIFSDSIISNITESDDNKDIDRVFHALQQSNLKEFIDELPQGLNTKIGAKGSGISLGQKQRIFIARAIYKNPKYLFFDEATNALDSTNEKEIMQNLNRFLKGKTAIIVAHRLSTVKNADQIVVIAEGSIIEIGTHTELVKKRGDYYNLIKNQLELGK